MADSSEDAVAVAVAYVPGQAAPVEGIVTGVAVGEPAPQSSRRATVDEKASEEPAPRVSVAQSFLYSDQMAKVFSQFDKDEDGAISMDELRDMFNFLGLESAAADSKMPNFDTNKDGLIALSEWEQGLDDQLRELITTRINDEGKVA